MRRDITTCDGNRRDKTTHGAERRDTTTAIEVNLRGERIPPASGASSLRYADMRKHLVVVWGVTHSLRIWIRAPVADPNDSLTIQVRYCVYDDHMPRCSTHLEWHSDDSVSVTDC